MYKTEHNNRYDIKQDKIKEADTGILDISHLIDDAWKGFVKYWVYLLVLVSFCAGMFYLYAKKTYVPVYRSSTTFIVNTNQAVNYSGEYYNNATAEQLAKTFPYIISNNALKHIIAEDLGVTNIPGEITATAMEDTNMVTISVTAGDAQMSYDILQSVIANYPKVAKVVIGETQLTVIDEAVVPTRPTNSQDFKAQAKNGLIVGCVLSLIIIGIYAVTRKTIRNEDDIKKFLSIKCYGTVPRARFKKRRSEDENLVLIDNKRIPYGFVEANRTVRTRVEKEHRENGASVFLVTSSVAGEGKTTVAVNLALSLAQKGRDVILVDADMRHPSVNNTMGLGSSQFGLKDVLNGTVTLEKALTRYKETHLWIVPGGTPIQSTDKLLTGPEIKKVFDELRKTAEYVIIDTPPSGFLFDSAFIAKEADAGIFVVRQDTASLDKITDGIEMLSDAKLRMAGCVLNCAEVGITGYGYGKGYGYGRGYGYGYGKYGYGKYGYGDIKQED